MKNVMPRLKTTLDAALRLLLSAALVGMNSAFGVGVSSAFATPPTVTHFQGRLTDASNNPLSGAQNFMFEIYDSAAGGSVLWSEVQNSVNVVNGVFNVELGAVNPLSAPVFAAGATWLRVTVNGIPMSPRERLATSPYSFNSATLEGREYAHFVTTSTIQTIAGAKTFTESPTVPAPSLPGHAANMAYVDSQAVGASGWTKTGAVVALTNAADNAVVQSSFTVYGAARVEGALTAAGGVSGNLTGNVTGNVTGNADTATALAADPADCAAGSAPLGVTASGAASGCFDVATQTELNTHAALTGSSAHGATSANTASQIVTRDASGNFSAGTITATFSGNVTGNASTASALAANGANCVAGEAALGVSAAGAAEGCYDVATQTELDGHVNATSVHSATDANTPSRIVMRDVSGNFSAGTITAGLSGNATTASALAANGANCVAGEAALGVSAAGAAEGCYDVATQTELNTHAALTGSSAHGATSANTASQIVTRDASGNFSAGTITASLTGNVTGNASTASALAADPADCSAGNAPLGVTASGAASGCYDVATQTELNTHAALTGSSAHGATSANTASQIVARDASGNFAAGTITAATITGLAAPGADLTAAANKAYVDAQIGGAGGWSKTNAVVHLADETDNAVVQSSFTVYGAAYVGGVLTAAGGVSGNLTGNVTGNVTGNASTASALAADPADCSAGSAPLGVTASGAASGCFDVATQAELNTHAALTGSSAHGATSANTASQIVARDASGNFSAGTITANLTGNVTGGVTGNATSATNLASGAVGQIPYQTGSGATAFLPAMAAGGIVVGGGTTVIPSTAALQGTASQITVTQTPTALTLSLPATINVDTSGNAGTATALAADGADCSAGNAPLGVTAAGAASGCFDVATQAELNTHAALTGSSAHGATSANTASQIVARDASGNFSAGTITASLTGSVTGNATTASALAANGANCLAGEAALGVSAAGAAEGCYDVATQTELNTHAALTGSSAHGATSANTVSQIVARDASGNFSAGTITAALSGNVTGNVTGNASTASALAANGANCLAGEAALGVSAAGAAEGCYDVATQTELNTHAALTGSSAHGATSANTASQIVTRDASGNFSAGTITATFSGNLTGAVTGNASTASALAADPADCSAGNAPLGVTASGAASGCFDVATQTELNTHAGLTGSSAHGATSANTASQIVTRDASGNFAAGTITGSVFSVNGSGFLQSESAPYLAQYPNGVASTSVGTRYYRGNGATYTSMGYVYGDANGFGMLGDAGSWAINVPPGTLKVTLGGGATAASGSASGDTTIVNTVFFGTGGSYKVTNAGAATLAASSVGDLTKNAAAFHLGNTGGAGTADAFVFWNGATGSGTRIASINHQKDMKAGAYVTTGTPDLAEYAQAEPDVEAADVVSVSETLTQRPGPGGERFQIRKSRRPYEAQVLGVVADGTSGFRIHAHMGDIDKSHPGKPLVLAGRVPVKVTLENGPIRVGDYLTASSKPGYAMRATEPGATIGVALEGFEGGDVREGKVLCFVHIGERNSATKLQMLEDRIEKLESLLRAGVGGGR